jgi:hypothetical protein
VVTDPPNTLLYSMSEFLGTDYLRNQSIISVSVSLATTRTSQLTHTVKFDFSKLRNLGLRFQLIQSLISLGVTTAIVTLAISMT